ncbi:TetR/AcrR family transcriptional regulator [Streptomyces heliomycini]|uniref:TetR/AcrR family transcriptional regulator n=1 Tax=Streptomyces heliomycini TaxID=284032 RepID=A0ABV5LD80_9ACTN
MPQTGSGATTREAAHSAAARILRNQGLSRITVRRIAAVADTDPALVIRHFESGEPLFLETAHLTIDDEPLLDVPLERLGDRLAELLVGLDGSVRGSSRPRCTAATKPRSHRAPPGLTSFVRGPAEPPCTPRATPGQKE